MSAFGSGGGGGRLNPIWSCVVDDDFECDCDGDFDSVAGAK